MVALRMKKIVLLASIIGIIDCLAVGCGQEGSQPQAGTAPKSSPEPSASTPSTPPTPVKVAVPAPETGGTIAGRVRYEGPAPRLKPINFGPELKCSKLHEGKEAPKYETVVVNPNGTLKWVLIYVDGKVPGRYRAPSESVTIDQTGCVFVPHAVAAMVRQPVEYRNSDPLLHNVRGAPKKNTPFNMAFPEIGSKKVGKFIKPEIGIVLKCDVHYWMSGYIHVLEHPFFAITQDDGAFVIEKLPPGEYTIKAWHEKLQSEPQVVTVKDGEVTDLDFVFRGS